MTNPRYLDIAYQHANEPKVHRLLEKSFAYVQSAGMRLAPEVLILEFMRELCWENHIGDVAKGIPLVPWARDRSGEPVYSTAEQAVINALKGRRKKSKAANEERFFAPAYPQLTRYAWIGRKRERVIRNFLLNGPIARYFWETGQQSEVGLKRQSRLANLVADALLGSRSYRGGDQRESEILSVAIKDIREATDKDTIVKRFTEQTQVAPRLTMGEDELATRIASDLTALCRLEDRLPRIQWLQLMMTFLRFALPMWLIAQIQITDLLHEWLVSAIDNNVTPSSQEMRRMISERNRKLLHPTLTPTRELFQHVENYMKKRIELNILLYLLEVVNPGLRDRILTVDSLGADYIEIDDLVIMAKHSADQIWQLERYKAIAPGESIATFLTREGEQFAGWRRPRMKGQGKNIDEFFRVLYRAEVGDEAGGYLVVPEGRGASRGFRVFPGQLLLKTVAQLAAEEKLGADRGGNGGRLVLKDLEAHFAQYGIEFANAADARPLLMGELQAMGLLVGSPDAGSSVAVANPYQV